MSGLREFMNEEEVKRMDFIAREIAFFKAERKRIANRALMRRARAKARTSGIREINERIGAAEP